MRVRAVAAALAVWCASGAAMAAGYAEVWNPPEASGHAGAKPAKKPGAGKAGQKDDAKHAARGSHKATRSAPATGRGDKPAAHGGVKKVAAKGAKGDKKLASAAASRNKPKAAVTAQAQKPPTSSAHARAGQHEIARADAARPHAVHMAAKSGAATAVTSRPNTPPPVASANVGGGAPDASTNPATANSGSLPPIIH